MAKVVAKNARYDTIIARQYKAIALGYRAIVSLYDSLLTNVNIGTIIEQLNAPM